MKSKRKELGRKGEEAARRYLEQQGMRVECSNWRCKFGELDLIAWENTTLVFVEVRSRSPWGERFGGAIEAVDRRKQRKVKQVASCFLQFCKQPHSFLRFDVVAVDFDENNQVEITHIRNAFL